MIATRQELLVGSFFLAVRLCHTVGMSESICISGMAAVYNGFADEQTKVTPSGYFFHPCTAPGVFIYKTTSSGYCPQVLFQMEEL